MLHGRGLGAITLAGVLAMPPAVPAAYETLLESAEQESVTLMQLDAWLVGAGGSNAIFRPLGAQPLWTYATSGAGDAATTSFYWADKVFCTGPSDTVDANRPWIERLQRFTASREVAVRPEAGPRFAVAAQAVLDNADGELDDLPSRYAVGGRPATVQLGPAGGDLDDFGTLAELVGESWARAAGTLRLQLAPRSFNLETALREDTYAGTGGAEGGADLAGKEKVRAFGKLRNVAPPLLNSDLVYDLNGGNAIQTVDGAYDRGVALTFDADYASYAALVAAAIPSGQYGTCLAEGCLRLGATPDGQVTVDLQGDATGSGYVSSRSGICLRILKDLASVSASYIVTSRWTALDAYATAGAGDVGIWLSEEESPTTAQVVDRLVGGIGFRWGVQRDGRLVTLKLNAPEDRTPAVYVTADDLLALEEDGSDAARWRHRVAYQKNWTRQTSDLDAALTAARRAFLAQERRLAEAKTVSRRTDYLDAQDAPVLESLYDAEADAQAVADDLQDRDGQERRYWRATAWRWAFNVELGAVHRVTWPRDGLGSGRNLLVVGIDDDTSAATVTITYWG